MTKINEVWLWYHRPSFDWRCSNLYSCLKNINDWTGFYNNIKPVKRAKARLFIENMYTKDCWRSRPFQNRTFQTIQQCSIGGVNLLMMVLFVFKFWTRYDYESSTASSWTTISFHRLKALLWDLNFFGQKSLKTKVHQENIIFHSRFVLKLWEKSNWKRLLERRNQIRQVTLF